MSSQALWQRTEDKVDADRDREREREREREEGRQGGKLADHDRNGVFMTAVGGWFQVHAL